MREYKSYKTTSEKHLQKVPAHWQTIPLQYLFEIHNGYTPSKQINEFWQNGTIPWFRMEDIRKHGRILKDSIQHVTKAAVKSGKPFPANSIILATTATIGEHALVIADSLANQQFTIFSNCKSLLQIKFAYYYFFVIGDWCKTCSNISTFPAVDVNRLKRFTFLIPPSAEQEAIVRFLDWKVTKINKLVSVKRRQLVALEELKNVLVAKVVTQGVVDGNVHVECRAKWLGVLPSHWQCKKIGSLFTERRTKVSDKDYPPLSVTKMGVLPQLEDVVKTDNGDNRKLVCAGDFVINSRSDRKGSCGTSQLDGSVSLINSILTPREQLNNRYVHYLLRSQPFSEEFYRNGRGIVGDLWTTRYSEMKTILFPVPPPAEQDQIVRFLDKKVADIDKLINIKRNEVERLNELKNCWISDVVTGKIDVRDIEVPEYKFEDDAIDNFTESNDNAEESEELEE